MNHGDQLTRAYMAFQKLAKGAAVFTNDGRTYVGIRALITASTPALWSCPAYHAPAGWKWTYSVREANRMTKEGES